MKKTILTAAIAAMVLTAGVALAAAPVCGDVNNDSSVKTTDALLVLKKAVAQPITLDCSAYDNQFAECETFLAGSNASLSACHSNLSTTNADLGACHGDLAVCLGAPVCGNGLIEGGESCEVGDLNGATCATRPGFTGGTLDCSFCSFDTSGCYATRFVDNLDGTVTDNSTKLTWEKKTTDVDSGTDFSNPHDVDNYYTWTAGTTAPNGAAFTDFLDKLNGQDGAGTGFAGHYDWRLPTAEELQGIVDLGAPGCGSGSPCIDAVFGPRQLGGYWSASTNEDAPTFAWLVGFYFGNLSTTGKTADYYVRAVRAGS